MLVTLARLVISVLPESAANSITRFLAGMTRRPPLSLQQGEAMAQATKIRYGANDENVAWAWGEGRS